MRKKEIISRLTAPILIAVIGILMLASKDSRQFKMSQEITIFNSIVKQLDLLFVDTIDAQKTVNYGIQSMLSTLDPYTTYFPAEDDENLERLLHNSYGGIGSVITYDTKTNMTVISEPYKGMPADKAGLKPGDTLIKIDSVWLQGKQVGDVSNLLRGPSGTKLVVKIKQIHKKDTLTIPIVRRSIEIPTIPYYGKLSNGVGYIQLRTFTGKPAAEFRTAFMDLKQQGITHLVIDLRSNGGGLITEAIEIANYFLPKGDTITSTKGRNSNQNEVYKTTKQPLDTEIPIAILVNSNSASASEILSGALQDLDRGIIIGTKTYGKGLVQSTRQVPYGGTLKLTTAKYYTPSGRCVQAIDYSRRNKDGSVGRIPDSLTNIFHTHKGRIVRDGGGITPDIEVGLNRLPNILFYMAKDNLFFHFANEYAAIHPSITSANDFIINDSTFKAFKQMAIKANFTYDPQSKKILKSLREAAEFEGYAKDAKLELDALEKKLKHNLSKDIENAKNEIKEMLASNILQRYYYQQGPIIEQLKNDSTLIHAIHALTDSKRYNKILSKINPGTIKLGKNKAQTYTRGNIKQ